MTSPFEDALRQLTHAVQQVENLVAWLDLEKSESQPGCSVGFRWHSSTEQDLRAQAGAFLSQYFDLHKELGRRRHSVETERMRERLLTIYRRFSRAAPAAL